MILKQTTLALTTHATTYSFAIPASATNLRFQVREGDTTVLYSFDNFTTYYTLPKPVTGGRSEREYNNNWRCSPNGQTLYVQAVTNDGKTLEIEYSIDG